ncbi:Lysophosphatidic acid receptor 1-B [Takifugu flavidus]|uniref:Lysophosphatidic acid receptor 1-B n=1 Tax=Takifugu flavidus TaxID=433684 RepID=A0A5C6NKE9_9TELE|nr:Lysophosphatidic acid receptor 1-B [Takifugu flavidus]
MTPMMMMMMIQDGPVLVPPLQTGPAGPPRTLMEESWIWLKFEEVAVPLGAFIVCWTPGLVILLLDVFCSTCNILTFEKFFLLLAEFNSAMNPIIYSYRDKEMSATFRQILCCRRQENVNGATAEGSDRSASSVNHTVLSGAMHHHHNNEHSVV